jgi:hypothetical protein
VEGARTNYDATQNKKEIITWLIDLSCQWAQDTSCLHLIKQQQLKAFHKAQDFQKKRKEKKLANQHSSNYSYKPNQNEHEVT